MMNNNEFFSLQEFQKNDQQHLQEIHVNNFNYTVKVLSIQLNNRRLNIQYRSHSH